MLFPSQPPQPIVHPEWSPPVYRELTGDERAVVAALGNVTMLPGCSDKRFAKMMRRAKRISQAGAWYLADLRHRYRRQIPAAVPWLARKDLP